MRFSNKVAVVTGSSRNIGLSIAKRLGKEGAKVVINGRHPEKVEKALSKLTHIECIGIPTDLSTQTGCEQLINKTIESFGTIDILVNNAVNLGLESYLANFTEDFFQEVMSVNLKVPLLCSRLAFKYMKSGSVIINISSNGAQRAHRGRLLYDISKGALESATRAMALELASERIRVNTIIPGDVRTDRWETLTSEEVSKRRQVIPLNTETTGDDVAAAVAFLCSEDAKNITGASIVVDGGIQAQLRPAYEEPSTPS